VPGVAVVQSPNQEPWVETEAVGTAVEVVGKVEVAGIVAVEVVGIAAVEVVGIAAVADG